MGIPAYLLQRLQSVLNVAARLIFSSPRFDHISLLLCRLHWLKASQTLSASSGVQISTWSGANVPVWRTTSTGRHWSQMTTTFCLINVSGRSTYSSILSVTERFLLQPLVCGAVFH